MTKITIPDGVEIPEGDEFELLIRVRRADEESTEVEIIEVEGVPLEEESEEEDEEEAPPPAKGFVEAADAGLGALG